MRRYLVLLLLSAVACHTDSAVAPDQPSGMVMADAKNMAVGEVRVLTPPQVPNGIELSTNAAVTDYLVVVANTSTALDVQADYKVLGDLLSGGAARATLASAKMVATDEALPDAQQMADGHIRAFERAFLNPANALHSNPAARNSLGISPIASATVTRGTQVPIRVPNEAGADLCLDAISTTGTVMAVSNRAIIIQDNQATSAFTQADFDAIAKEFDEVVFPTDISYFGQPTDIDANQRIVLYYTPEVNKLTKPGERSFIGGFFFAGDFYDPSKTRAQGGCPQSNQGEIFYLLAPDPAPARFGNTRTTTTVRQGTRGTVAHEFQHMINAGIRLASRAAFESVWLDEGLAHTAEDAVGRVVKSFSDFQTLSDKDLFPPGTAPGSSAANDYNAFFGPNLGRFSFWLQAPDTSSGLSKHADKNLSSRGAIWALLRWTGDQYSGGDFRAFTRKLAAGPDTGVKNLIAGAGQPLDTLLAGWMVANFADHNGIPGLAAKYNYVGYNMRNAIAGANNGVYPLQVNPLASGASITTKSLPGSGTYYKVTVPAGATRTIKVQDPSGAGVSFPGAHYYVLRID